MFALLELILSKVREPELLIDKVSLEVEMSFPFAFASSSLLCSPIQRYRP
jgi:hypothetical protein